MNDAGQGPIAVERHAAPASAALDHLERDLGAARRLGGQRGGGIHGEASSAGVQVAVAHVGRFASPSRDPPRRIAACRSARAFDLAQVSDVLGIPSFSLAARRAEPSVEDLARARRAEVSRRLSASTLASFQRRAPSAVGASRQSAARTPGTLLAAIEAPVPVQQATTAWSARPSATSRAAASLAHAQSSRSPPRRRREGSAHVHGGAAHRAAADAMPVSSSAATEIRIGHLVRRRRRPAGAQRARSSSPASGAIEPLAAVGAHALDQWDERPPLLGQRVLDARRHLGICLALDDSLLLERPQAQRQRARADPLERALELTEARPALGQITDHEQRPFAAHDLGGSAYGAGPI